MKTLAIALAASLIGSAAFAQTTTVIQREGVTGDTTIIRKDAPATTIVKERVESTGSVGCETKSVTKTNEDGDSVNKTKTDC